MVFCFLKTTWCGPRGRRSYAVCARVLIVDWDVHHGNGTQALVERDPSIRFVLDASV